MSVCKCGHEVAKHHHGKSCTAIIDDVKLRYCKCDQFRESNLNQNGENEMAKKEKKPRTLLVVRYEVAAKDGKELLAKDNTSQAAFMYRALAAAKEPLTIKECYAVCEGKMESAAAWERLGKNLNSTLFALRKAGYIKKSGRREEVAETNGAAPKKARKRSAKKPVRASVQAMEDSSEEAMAKRAIA